MKHSWKKAGCLLLSLAMALTLLPAAALAARGDKDDTLSPEYTYSNNGYTLEKVSHAETPAGESDGFVDYYQYTDPDGSIRTGVVEHVYGQRDWTGFEKLLKAKYPKASPEEIAQMLGEIKESLTSDACQSYAFSALGYEDWVYIGTMYGGTGITKQNVYKHAKNVLWTTVPALVVSLIIFTVLGIRYSGIAMNQEGIDVIRNGLAANYHFSPVLWIPFIVLVVSIVLKVPALASLMFGCIAGLIVALIFQGDGVSAVLGFMWNGYSASTGLESIDKILNRGGMTNMMYIIGIVLTSMSLAGLFDRTNLLLTIVAKFQRLTRTRVGLIVTTMVTGIITSFVCSDPYIAALVPVKAFEHEYEKQGLDVCVLSRTVSDGGICFAPMVPWGSNGVFCATTLGITTATYTAYYFMGWLTPLFAILCAITGIGIKYVDGKKPVKGQKAAAAESAEA